MTDFRRNQVVLRVYLDSNTQQSVEVPVTPETTCRDIVDCCCEPGVQCHLAELWRGCERPVADEEKPYEILQQWGQHRNEVRFYLRKETPYDDRYRYGQQDSTSGKRNGVKDYEISESHQLPPGSDLSIHELQQMAVRQQEQIETQQQVLVAKEQRLKFLRQQEQKHQQISSENDRLRKLREKVETQELKLKKLRALRGQLDQHKSNNGTHTLELDTIKALFNEKEKELSMAVAKVEELTSQMEELRIGRINGMNGTKNLNSAAAAELNRLKNELLMRNKLNTEQTTRINGQREILGQRQNEVTLMDKRIEELQQRLRKKRAMQDQQVTNQNIPPRKPLNRPPNVAAVEPYIKHPPKETKTQDDMHPGFGPSKQDPKYQSLPPYNINKKDIRKNGVENGPLIYDVPSNEKLKGNASQNNNIPNFVPASKAQYIANVVDSPAKPKTSISQNFANFTPKPYGSTQSTAFNGRTLDISTMEARTDGSGQSSPAVSDSSVSQYPPSSAAPNINHSTPDTRPQVTRPGQVSTGLETTPSPTKPIHTTAHTNQLYPPHTSRSSSLSTQPPDVSPIYAIRSPLPVSNNQQNHQGVVSSHNSHVTSNRAVDSRTRLSSNAENGNRPRMPSQSENSNRGFVPPRSDHATVLEPSGGQAAKPPPLEPRGVQPGTQTIVQGPISRDSPVKGLDTSVTSVNSALSVLMGNTTTTTTTPTKTMPTYRYASRSAISNLYMNKLGSSTVDQYRKNMAQIYSNAEQPSSPTPKLPPRIPSPTKQPSEIPGSPTKAGSPVRTVPPGYPPVLDSIEKAHYKAHTPKALHRRHSSGDGDESPMRAFVQEHYGGQEPPSAKKVLFEENKRESNTRKEPRERKHAPKVLKKSNKKSNKSKSRRVSFDPLALLLDASLEGELELVKKTAEQVSNPSEPNDEGITALHNAICAGHYEIVKFLVEFGCDVNSPDSDGWTPLHCAASCNNLPMVKLLVDHGACIFATTISDHETAAQKCEEDEDGYDGCSEYLYSIQEKLGIMNNGAVYAVFDYQANNIDEISYKNGDQMFVLRKGDETEKEWWWAKRKDREGYIPRNLLGLYPRVKNGSRDNESEHKM